MNTKSDALLRIKEHQDAILKEFEEMSPTELEELYGTKGRSNNTNNTTTAQPPQPPKPENRVSPGFNAPLPPMAWITDPNANVNTDVYYWDNNRKMWILG